MKINAYVIITTIKDERDAREIRGERKREREREEGTGRKVMISV